jgi:prepilin-type N-terminal cleavage/methylation domain-containing protein
MKNSKKKQKKNNFGFTLIELLVVISIIGLLASVVLVSLSSARQKSRVAKRLTDLKQVQTALELYYGDYNQYPSPTTWAWRSECTSWQGLNATSVIPGLVPTYLNRMPSEPSMTQPDKNCYLYISTGSDYKFLDYNIIDMTPAQINQYPTFKDPLRNIYPNDCGVATGQENALSVYTPGLKCQ